MMGRVEQDQGQLFYSFCLEEVVPDDHQVRAIASVLDLSWVYGELSPHYPALGRPSIDPILMIRMLILATPSACGRSVCSVARSGSIWRTAGFAACCQTFWTAASCKSGGYPYSRSSRFTCRLSRPRQRGD